MTSSASTTLPILTAPARILTGIARILEATAPTPEATVQTAAALRARSAQSRRRNKPTTSHLRTSPISHLLQARAPPHLTRRPTTISQTTLVSPTPTTMCTHAALLVKRVSCNVSLCLHFTSLTSQYFATRRLRLTLLAVQ